MRLFLPWPPVSTNGIWRTSSLGHTYLRPEAKAYKQEIALRVRMAVQAGAQCPEGPLPGMGGG